MNKAEFQKAFVIAESDEDLTNVDIDSMIGFGLRGFKKVAVTCRMMARMIRYQAMQMNGEWDSVELASLRGFARTKFEVVG